MKAAQRDGIAANIRVWSMLRFRALFCAGRLADARAEAEATIEMADEIGDGSYGYINHVALYILGRVALHTGDPAGLAQAGRSAAAAPPAAGVARPASASARGSWPLLADADGRRRPGRRPRRRSRCSTRWPAARCPTTSPRMYADAAALTRMLLARGQARGRGVGGAPAWRTSPPASATSRSSSARRCTPARCSTATPTSRCGRSR